MRPCVCIGWICGGLEGLISGLSYRDNKRRRNRLAALDLRSRSFCLRDRCGPVLKARRPIVGSLPSSRAFRSRSMSLYHLPYQAFCPCLFFHLSQIERKLLPSFPRTFMVRAGFDCLQSGNFIPSYRGRKPVMSHYTPYQGSCPTIHLPKPSACSFSTQI